MEEFLGWVVGWWSCGLLIFLISNPCGNKDHHGAPAWLACGGEVNHPYNARFVGRGATRYSMLRGCSSNRVTLQAYMVSQRTKSIFVGSNNK
jgi:hypothetical protein